VVVPSSSSETCAFRCYSIRGRAPLALLTLSDLCPMCNRAPRGAQTRVAWSAKLLKGASRGGNDAPTSCRAASERARYLHALLIFVAALFAEQSRAQKNARETSRVDVSPQRSWRGVALHFILKHEQPRASRLLRDSPSGFHCVQSAGGDGAPPPQRRGAECREPGEETAQAAAAGGPPARVRQQDRARSRPSAQRLRSRLGRALTAHG